MAKLQTSKAVRFIVILTVVFSLGVLPGPVSRELGFPTLHLAQAASAPVQCHTAVVDSECWYPGGPAMDTLKVSILGDAASELNCIQQPSPCVDLTDTPTTPPSILPEIQGNPKLLVTSPV